MAGEDEEVDVSVLAPALNEEGSLGLLVDQVEHVLGRGGRSWEIVVVLDGCTDGSLEVLLERRKGCPKLKVIELAERIGQHGALAVGLRHVRGRCVVTLDADLQNPPSAIPAVVERLERGADAVGTVRAPRSGPVHRKIASRMFRACLRAMGVSSAMSDPGCMLRGWRREVIERFLASGEPAVYLPLQLNRYANTFDELEVEHRKRAAGRSKYNVFGLTRLFFRTIVARYSPALGSARPPVIRGVYGFGDAKLNKRVTRTQCKAAVEEEKS